MVIRATTFGSEPAVQKLTESLKGIGIELVSLTKVLEVITLLKQQTFDLALVDSLAEHVEAVCHYIREFESIPLVVIVNEKTADWRRLQSLDAHGFLPEEATKDELAARLKVVWRRFLLSDKLRKAGLRPSALHFSAERNTGSIPELPCDAEFQGNSNMSFMGN